MIEGRMMEFSQILTGIRDAIASLDSRIGASETRADARFESFERRVDARFAAADQRMDSRIAASEQRMDARFAVFEHTLNARFEQVDHRFAQIDRRFEQVDRSFEQAGLRFATLETKVDGGFGALDAKMSRYFTWSVGIAVTILAAVVTTLGAVASALLVP